MKTFFKDLVDYWEERGFKSTALYKRGNLTLWDIDVPGKRASEEVNGGAEYKALLMAENNQQYDVIEDRFLKEFCYAVTCDSAGANVVVHVGIMGAGKKVGAVAVFEKESDFPGRDKLDTPGFGKITCKKVQGVEDLINFLALVLEANTKHLGFCVLENDEENVEVYDTQTLLHVVLRKGITDGTLDAMKVIQALRGRGRKGGEEQNDKRAGDADAVRGSNTLH